MKQNFELIGRILLVIFFAAGALISLHDARAGFPGNDLESVWHLKSEAGSVFRRLD